MPAFTFEKLPPPNQLVTPAIPPKQHRGIIVQLLDRLTESKLEKNTRAFETAPAKRLR